MKPSRVLPIVAVMAVPLPFTMPAAAQNYPAKTIRIIVPARTLPDPGIVDAGGGDVVID